MTALFATLCAVSGIGLLYGSWRGLVQGRFVVPAGWAALMLALVLWIVAANAEFGLIYGVLSVCLCAWLAVAFNYEVRRRHDAPAPASAAITLDSRGLLRHLGLFVVVVPLCGVAALLLSIIAARVLPGSLTNALATAVLLLPVLWGLGAYWACADSKPLRPALVLTTGSALCAAWLFL